ncbi:hypothetical protein LINPERPRIM_LOCUS24272 [Linum perenne]
MYVWLLHIVGNTLSALHCSSCIPQAGFRGVRPRPVQMLPCCQGVQLRCSGTCWQARLASCHWIHYTATTW